MAFFDVDHDVLKDLLSDTDVISDTDCSCLLFHSNELIDADWLFHSKVIRDCLVESFRQVDDFIISCLLLSCCLRYFCQLLGNLTQDDIASLDLLHR